MQRNFCDFSGEFVLENLENQFLSPIYALYCPRGRFINLEQGETNYEFSSIT